MKILEERKQKAQEVLRRQKEHQRLAEFRRNEQFLLAAEDAKKEAIKYDGKQRIQLVKEKEKQLIKEWIEDI